MTGCKCQKDGNVCPVGGNCVDKNIVYKATVTTRSGSEYYTGLTSRTFKTRYKEHNNDFINRTRKGTHLSTHVRELKDKGEAYSVSWTIADRAPPSTQ